MKKCLFLLIISLVSLSELFAQDTLTKVIIIDSLEFDQGLDEKYLQDFSLFGQANDKVLFDDNFWIKGHFPAVTCKVKFLASSDLSMTMLIDNRNSRIELHHMERLEDTIRISRHKIFRNCLVDSTISDASFYHMVNGSIISTYKNRERRHFGEKRCDTLKKVSITINGYFYTVLLQSIKANNIQIGCGCRKKRDKKKEAKYKDAESKGIVGKKIKYNRASYSYEFYYNSYSGSIDFNDQKNKP